MGEDKPATGSERDKIFSNKILKRKDPNKKSRMGKQHGNRLANTGPKVEIHPDALKAIPYWKTPGINRFWFYNAPPYTTDILPK